MKRISSILILAFSLSFILFSCQQTPEPVDTTEASTEKLEVKRPAYAIAIHGGAGTIKKENMTPEMEQAYTLALNKALDIGEQVLKQGGTSIDAIEQTIIFLENSSLFNAGKGAVFTHSGKNEMDASFMNGADLNAGAIGGVTNVKNPIRAARAVMEQSEHVMLSGVGAEQFAEEQGLEIVAPAYFYTKRRWDSLQKAKEETSKLQGMHSSTWPDYKFGTVGCAALDKYGNLAAGTSTGGMTNKRYNRIGDSPIIGAGTYANNATCAISSTGHGEFFIRYTVAHDISALMEYKEMSLEEAGKEVINNKLVKAGGTGGVIAVDKDGNVAMPFNTEGMYRGYAKPNERVVKIYKD